MKPALILLAAALPALAEPVRVHGDLKQWHKVTLDLEGPRSRELDTAPNPFTDLSMVVEFRHESGQPRLLVPGYFAADGEAVESGATAGKTWRTHLSPSKSGRWEWSLRFHGGKHAALHDPARGAPPEAEELAPWHGMSGTFEVAPSDKRAPDLRGRGRLEYVGERYLRFAGDGSYFLKAGADAPETLLAYRDFDGTRTANPKRGPLKSWQPHVRDWREGDPSWRDGKGKGLVGAFNYLADQGMNAVSFLPYNAGGDGDNVWPFVEREQPLHYDCSKLDQWGLLFDHAATRGLFLHFKLQETENDDLDGPGAEQALDGGELGPERKLYLRELIARFAHHPALNWNLGEENTQSLEQRRAMARWIRALDPYDHPIVLHTYPDQQDKLYGQHLGPDSVLDGLSIQNDAVAKTHAQTVKWVRASAGEEVKRWIVSFDEPGTAKWGTPPDDDWPGVAERRAKDASDAPTLDRIRAEVLWGHLLGGGAGVEYYFGYQLPENDLNLEDWRSRSQVWKDSRIALQFFRDAGIPFWDMQPLDEWVGNDKHDNSRYCLAKEGELYLVYLPAGGTSPVGELDGDFTRQWFNPRSGEFGPVERFQADQLKAPDDRDWLAIIRRKP